MKFQYLGKKEDMKVFGADFTNGATPDVTDEYAIKKLSGNRHFAPVTEDKKTFGANAKTVAKEKVPADEPLIGLITKED
jgi:hypothetical protein